MQGSLMLMLKGTTHLPQNIKFLTPYIIATWCCRPLLFQTMNSFNTTSLFFKYQRFIPSGEKDKGVRKLEFVANIQSHNSYMNTRP